MTEADEKIAVSLYGVAKAFYDNPENVRGFEEWMKKNNKEKEVNPNE